LLYVVDDFLHAWIVQQIAEAFVCFQLRKITPTEIDGSLRQAIDRVVLALQLGEGACQFVVGLSIRSIPTEKKLLMQTETHQIAALM